MSRSRRKTPIFGNAGTSEKQDKRKANRRHRRMERVALKEGKEPPQGVEEVSSTWVMAKDGKHYWHEASEKDMRK